jgi:hypothetical protein
MSTPLPTLARPAYCPNCGYDLRAATSPVCSECGASVGRGISSQIPWMQRKWRGTAAAYVATAGLVLWRPSLFVQEIQWRMPARDPRKFLHVSILLASLTLTALCALAFAFHEKHWLDCMPDVALIDYHTLTRPTFTSWPVAAFALWDSWFILIPFSLTTLFTLWITQWLYRHLLVLSAGPPRIRRRLNRMGMYLSAMTVWQAPLLGFIAIVAMIQMESPPWAEDWRGTMLGAQMIAGALAAFLFLAPSIGVVVRTGEPSRKFRWWFYLTLLGALLSLKVILATHVDSELLPLFDLTWQDTAATFFAFLIVTMFLGVLVALLLWKWRWQTLPIVYLILVYPLATAFTFLAFAAAAFWLCGYVALAFGSMFR